MEFLTGVPTTVVPMSWASECEESFQPCKTGNTAEALRTGLPKLGIGGVEIFSTCGPGTRNSAGGDNICKDDRVEGGDEGDGFTT